MITRYWRAPAPPSLQRGGRPHPICKVLHSRLAPPPLLAYPAAPSAEVSDPQEQQPSPLPEPRAGHSPGHGGRRTAPRPDASPPCPLPPALPELGGSRRAQAGRLAGSLARSLARPLPAASGSPGSGGLHRDRGRGGEAPWEAPGAEGRGGAAAEAAPSLLPALGAALGDFPSPGEKCVCVWDGAPRARMRCPKLPDPGFFAPSLRSRPL